MQQSLIAWDFKRSTAAAAGLHVALLVGVLPLALHQRSLLPISDDPLQVELVPPAATPLRPVHKSTAPQPLSSSLAEDASGAVETNSAPSTSPGRHGIQDPASEAASARSDLYGGLVAASKFYSAAVLSDPRSRRALKDLASLGDEEQILQVCNLEAMQQIESVNSGLKPDFVIAYAAADVRQRGLEVNADGAVFHSGDGWYALRYRCSASANHRGVEQFAFAVGDAVPKARWSELNLPSEVSSAD